jgi:uncharacterized coiled-coil protein SlyX
MGAAEALYQRINVLEQKAAVREQQIKTIENAQTTLTCKIDEINTKLTEIQLQLMKRLPAWGVFILTALCSITTGLAVYIITR